MRLIMTLSLTLLLPASIISAEVSCGSLCDVNEFPGQPLGLMYEAVTAHNHDSVIGEFRGIEVVPVRPATKFAAEVPEIFVIFRLAQHDTSFIASAEWYIDDSENYSKTLVAKDMAEFALEDHTGYLSIQQPGSGWMPGDYVVLLSVGHVAANLYPVGTVRFSIDPTQVGLVENLKNLKKDSAEF